MSRKARPAAAGVYSITREGKYRNGLSRKRLTAIRRAQRLGYLRPLVRYAPHREAPERIRRRRPYPVRSVPDGVETRSRGAGSAGWRSMPATGTRHPHGPTAAAVPTLTGGPGVS
jgi:hypothetical protein